MTPLHAFSFWAFLFVAFVAVVWALGDVLAPFIIGIALAYLLDPVADRLEAGGLSRRGATGFILGVFLLVLLVLLALVGPIVFEEVAHFLHNLPRLAAKAQSALTPYAQWLHDRIGTSKGENLTQTLTDQVGGAVSASGGGLIAGLQARGLAILRFLSMAAVMPIVAYYMILEWDHLVRWTRDLLPRRHEATVLDLLRRIDERLAGFLRGQIIVCVTLGLLYAVALSIAGLDYGLVIGLGAGLLSIIPLVGSTVGLLVGVIVAWTQTGELSFVAVVAGIFAAGQFMEGNILTPRLVGQSAGLHPLWILLALMAGGSLLGITGMLLAVPVAIVVAVLGEFALSLYRKSPLYACASEIVKPAHACLPQIPLDLAFPAAHTRADFLVAPANRDAVGWVDRWPDWPGPILILEGPPGCGKTHLARIWAARTGAAWIGPEEATTPPEASALAARGTHLALDPLDAWIGTADAETALFHLYNILKENGRSALATLRAPPATVAFTLPDLASRLRAAPMAAIRAPDDDLLSALLVKLFADRRLPVDADVIAYILPRMERSFAAARALVEAADRRALAEKRSLSVPLIRQTMEDLDRIGGL